MLYKYFTYKFLILSTSSFLPGPRSYFGIILYEKLEEG